MNTSEHSISSSTNQELPVVRPIRAEEMVWIEPPGHYGAYSKLLVNPDNSSTRYFDFRISLYQPRSHVADHVHTEAEHVYYILQGRGLMKLGGVAYVVEPNHAIFIPPGVAHSLANTGLENLLFIVVTVPAGELPRVDSSEYEQRAGVGPAAHTGEVEKA
jgi:mannose-6-phosphate isomerase-like protein (cupin superfamily)